MMKNTFRRLCAAGCVLASLAVSLPAAANQQLGIFGADTRENFSHSDFAQTDLANVGFLKVTYDLPNQRIEATCSAFLITPRLALTAAHCVWSPELRRAPDRIEFWLRYNGQPLPPQQIFTGGAPLVTPEWQSTFDLGYDYAAVPLSNKSYEDGLPVASASRNDVATAIANEQPLRIVGYPGSKGGRLYFDVSDDYKSQGRFLVHHADIERGQSGGPVLLGGTVIGVHSFMTEEFNASVLFDDAALQRIDGWKDRFQ
jgi:V8-like Glu-specific endopeptidase